MITDEQIKIIGQAFSEKWGEEMYLKANLAAINQILKDEGHEQKLYTLTIKAMDIYNKKLTGKE